MVMVDEMVSGLRNGLMLRDTREREREKRRLELGHKEWRCGGPVSLEKACVTKWGTVSPTCNRTACQLSLMLH